LYLINQSLNEVKNGIHLKDFYHKVGYDEEHIGKMLTKVKKIISFYDRRINIYFEMSINEFSSIIKSCDIILTEFEDEEFQNRTGFYKKELIAPINKSKRMMKNATKNSIDRLIFAPVVNNPLMVQI